MKRKYFKLYLKSIFKVYPAILLITIITALSIATACVMLLYANNTSEKQQKISIGVVGDLENSYLDIGLSVLKNIDSSKFYVDIVEFTEDDAVNALKNREINGYIQIPENYVNDIFAGKNPPAKYITLNSPEGFGTIISSEITEIVSHIITESQAGMYSAQRLAIDNNVKSIKKKTDTLMMSYLNHIFNRNNIYQLVTFGIMDSLSFVSYYACSLLVLFLMLWGISANRMFYLKNPSHSRLLNIYGVKPSVQVLCEYIAYLIITILTLLLFAVILGIVVSFIGPNIPLSFNFGITDCILFIIKIIPVIMMITMMQSAFYELIPNTVAAVLMQFILAILLGYISGCFYPNYFFPEIIQTVSANLPVGSGFSYIRKIISGTLPTRDLLIAFIYTALFFTITTVSRKHRITRR